MCNRENQLRVLKRKTHYIVEVDHDNGGYTYRIFDRSASHQFVSAANKVGHVPMGKELKRIRQLMASKHMTEQEVRSNLKHKLELSTLRQKAKLNTAEKNFIKVSRRVMRDLKLPIWNESVTRSIHHQLQQADIAVDIRISETGESAVILGAAGDAHARLFKKHISRV